MLTKKNHDPCEAITSKVQIFCQKMLDPEMEDRDDGEKDQEGKTITLSKFDQNRLVD